MSAIDRAVDELCELSRDDVHAAIIQYCLFSGYAIEKFAGDLLEHSAIDFYRRAT